MSDDFCLLTCTYPDSSVPAFVKYIKEAGKSSPYFAIEIAKGERHEEALQSVHTRVEVMVELSGVAGDAGGPV